MTEIERELRKRLGGALRAARLAMQLTQDDLASLVETDPETISRFERGATLPSLVRLLSLADALGVTIPRRQTSCRVHFPADDPQRSDKNKCKVQDIHRNSKLRL